MTAWWHTHCNQDGSMWWWWCSKFCWNVHSANSCYHKITFRCRITYNLQSARSNDRKQYRWAIMAHCPTSVCDIPTRPATNQVRIKSCREQFASRWHTLCNRQWVHIVDESALSIDVRTGTAMWKLLAKCKRNRWRTCHCTGWESNAHRPLAEWRYTLWNWFAPDGVHTAKRVTIKCSDMGWCVRWIDSLSTTYMLQREESSCTRSLALEQTIDCRHRWRTSYNTVSKCRNDSLSIRTHWDQEPTGGCQCWRFVRNDNCRSARGRTHFKTQDDDGWLAQTNYCRWMNTCCSWNWEIIRSDWWLLANWQELIDDILAAIRMRYQMDKMTIAEPRLLMLDQHKWQVTTITYGLQFDENNENTSMKWFAVDNAPTEIRSRRGANVDGCKKRQLTARTYSVLPIWNPGWDDGWLAQTNFDEWWFWLTCCSSIANQITMWGAEEQIAEVTCCNPNDKSIQKPTLFVAVSTMTSIVDEWLWRTSCNPNENQMIKCGADDDCGC